MTDEIPKRDQTNAVFCDECHTAVRLERGSYGLELVCACGDRRSLKVASALPDGWME